MSTDTACSSSLVATHLAHKGDFQRALLTYIFSFSETACREKCLLFKACTAV